MTAHVRACAHCGAGPGQIQGSGVCCWNPIGCGCDAVNAARYDLPVTGSTSAQLRQTQTALAASQADLTRVERERDEAREQLKRMSEFRAEAISACARVRDERDLARAELASARAELEQLRTRLNAQLHTEGEPNA